MKSARTALLWTVSVLSLLAAPAAAQCAVAPPSGCMIAGPGHPAPPLGPGSIPSSLMWPAGASPLCFMFPVPPASSGIVLVGDWGIAAPMFPPGYCDFGFLYVLPNALIPLPPGSPSTLCIYPPLEIRGSGAVFYLQGFTIDPARGCVRATDGYVLAL